MTVKEDTLTRTGMTIVITDLSDNIKKKGFSQ